MRNSNRRKTIIVLLFTVAATIGLVTSHYRQVFAQEETGNHYPVVGN